MIQQKQKRALFPLLNFIVNLFLFAMVISLLHEVSSLNELISQNSLFESQSKSMGLRKESRQNTFVSEKRDFSITLPEGYTMTGEGTEYLVLNKDAEKYSYIPEMSIRVLETSKDAYVGKIKSEQEDVQVEEIMAGRNTTGWRVRYWYTYPGMEVQAQATLYIFEQKENLFVLSTWENLHWDSFDQVAKSFRILKDEL